MHHAHQQVTDRNLHTEKTATTITTTTTMTTETEKIHAALVPLSTDNDCIATHEAVIQARIHRGFQLTASFDLNVHVINDAVLPPLKDTAPPYTSKHAALVPLSTDDNFMATHISGMHHAPCTSTSYRQKLTF